MTLGWADQRRSTARRASLLDRAEALRGKLGLRRTDAKRSESGLWVVVLAEPLHLLVPGLSFLTWGWSDNICFLVGSRG